MLLLTHVNSERLAVLVYPASAISEFALNKMAGSLRSSGLSVSLVDELGRSLVGQNPAEGQMHATRALAAAQLPWTLHLTRVPAQGTDGILSACFAMARGVIKELETARLQSDFVSAVSHEFRSPLTTLRQLTELLAHGRIQNEERRRLYFDVLQKETSRLHRLVENLLDFGRMEADRKQYSPEPLDLVDVVQEEVREYRDEVLGSGYSFEFGGDRLPTPVTADREAMRRIVRNLLENAVKYSPEKRTVWVETARENGSAVLTVRDEGMGIAADEQPKIFDKFVRGEAAKKACIQGTGIGLAMVKEIVRAHDGEVAVSSNIGEGSTFTVRLPLRRAANRSDA
jgi:signal transduction histidine kinase